MKNITNVIRITILLILALALTGCDGTANAQGATDYGKLCQIYADIVQQPIDLSMKEMKIIERVQKEFPDFFAKDFVHISKADPDRRYQFIKEVAEEEIKKAWDCDVMRSYYANLFK